MMYYRYFNNPESFEELGIPLFDDFNAEDLLDKLTQYRNSGRNPFTNAYLINSQACPGVSRDTCYALKVIPSLHNMVDDILFACKEMKSADDFVKFLQKLPACSGFISHEFYIDFCYIAKFTDRKFFTWDENDYTNVGPGADVGLRLIFPSLKNKKQGIYDLKKLAYLHLSNIAEQRKEQFHYLHWNKEKGCYDMEMSNIPNISLHQIEMWLCEYQKYWKVKHKVGKQRSRFQKRSAMSIKFK